MSGLVDIGVYIPEGRVSNRDQLARFNIDETFLREKLGVFERAVKDPAEETSDLCVRAFEALEQKRAVAREQIGCIAVVTQNPDRLLPHVAALVHGRLGLPEACASFDIGLGCSGYVQGLAIVLGLMQTQGIASGLLFTADPYSKIVDPDDKNTSLLFGDAATVTLLGSPAAYVAGPFTFGTQGAAHAELACANGASLFMNGQAVFQFAARAIPLDLQRLLKAAGLPLEQVDRFLLHQGSKFIVDTIAKRAGLPPEKVPFDIGGYGNTVSSSIPILLEKEMAGGTAQTIVMSGFGVGLAYASGLLRRATS